MSCKLTAVVGFFLVSQLALAMPISDNNPPNNQQTLVSKMNLATSKALKVFKDLKYPPENQSGFFSQPSKPQDRLKVASIAN